MEDATEGEIHEYRMPSLGLQDPTLAGIGIEVVTH